MDDFQRVKQGEVPVETEDDDYRARVAQAEADLLGAQAAIENLKARKAAQHAQVAEAEDALEATQADVECTRLEAARQRTLLATTFGRRQRVEQADAEAERFAATLSGNQADLDAQRSQMAVLDTQEAQLRADAKAKEAALDLAKINLGYTRIAAPGWSASVACAAAGSTSMPGTKSSPSCRSTMLGDQGNRLDWFNSGVVTGLLLGGGILAIAFLVREARAKFTQIHLGVLIQPNVAVPALLISIYGFGATATSFVLPDYPTRIAGLLGNELGSAGIQTFVRVREQVYSNRTGLHVATGLPATDRATAQSASPFGSRSIGVGDPAAQGAGLLANFVRREAYVLDYIDAFWLIAWVSLLVILLRPPPSNPLLPSRGGL